jgi:hypothetical protein
MQREVRELREAGLSLRNPRHGVDTLGERRSQTCDRRDLAPTCQRSNNGSFSANREH